MFVTGFAMACSTRVSNALGAGCPRVARRAAWAACAIALALELAAGGAILALRHSWARLFTSAPEVVSLTASLLPVFALSLPGDGLNATLQGLLRCGCRRRRSRAVLHEPAPRLPPARSCAAAHLALPQGQRAAGDGRTHKHLLVLGGGNPQRRLPCL